MRLSALMNIYDWVNKEMQRVRIGDQSRHMIPAGAVTDKLIEMQAEIHALQERILDNESSS